MSSALAAKALDLAKGWIGQHEEPKGSNRSPFIDAILHAVGQPPGQPWCAAFVYHCFAQAALALGVPNPLPATASCSVLYAWAREHGKLVSVPQAGDIFLVRGGPHGHRHTGLVAAVPNNWHAPTVEGNSNDDGSAEGWEVVARRPGRPVDSCDYVRV